MIEAGIAGVDEAGRGCLAGPVVAAAVMLHQPIAGLADSKVLTPGRRAQLAATIRLQARAWALGLASREEIDRLNILKATMLAMRRAVAALPVLPEQVRVDGNQDPRLDLPTVCVVGGDARHPEIMAASILAKTHRDALMEQLDQRYPGYGFAQHKGYGTAAHRRALLAMGLTPEHRRSFSLCRAVVREAGA